MRAYVVQVIPREGEARVSSEGYATLEAAEDFIRGRSGHPREICKMVWEAAGVRYLIFDVLVRGC